MFKISISGDKELMRELDKFAKTISKDANDFVVEFAKQGGKELVKQTEPFGTGNKSKGQSEGAASKDIAKVYKHTWKVAKLIGERNKGKAAAYVKAIENGNWDAAEKIARKVLGTDIDVTNFDGGALHKQSRNNQGKVENPSQSIASVDHGAINKYHEQKRSKAGLAKSGWYAAIVKLGGTLSGIPKWITRHGASLGSAKVSGTGDKKEVILTNEVPYVSNLLTDAKINKAISFAAKAVIRRWQKIVDSRKL